MSLEYANHLRAHETMKTLALTFALMTPYAFAGTLDACNKSVEELNKRMPLQIQPNVLAKDASCNKRLRSVQVSNTVEIQPPTDRTQVFISELRGVQQELWCKDSNLRKILKEFDVETRYYLLPKKKYIGKTRITHSRCPETGA